MLYLQAAVCFLLLSLTYSLEVEEGHVPKCPCVRHCIHKESTQVAMTCLVKVRTNTFLSAMKCVLLVGSRSSSVEPMTLRTVLNELARLSLLRIFISWSLFTNCPVPLHQRKLYQCECDRHHGLCNQKIHRSALHLRLCSFHRRFQQLGSSYLSWVHTTFTSHLSPRLSNVVRYGAANFERSKLGHPYTHDHSKAFGPTYYDCTGLVYSAWASVGYYVPTSRLYYPSHLILQALTIILVN